MISIHITESDRATPHLRQMVAGLQPARLAPVAARAAQQAVKEHLYARDAVGNRLGGRRTHYYGQAARSTHFTVEGNFVVIAVTQIGIRQRFYGGVIKPKTAKYLTIPVNPAAHGKTAREFGDLVFAIKPGFGPCLMRRGAVKVKRVKTKQIGRFKRDDTTTSTMVTSYGEDVVMYRLVKSVTQQPDPSTLPSMPALAAAIRPELDKYIATLTARAQGATS